MEIINLGAADGLPPVDWGTVVEKLDLGSAPVSDAHNARTTWLATVNEDGSPHVTAVGALWLDGTYWFQTGAGTRKVRNVAGDPRCSIAVLIRDADVVLEGEAARVTDANSVARAAKAWADQGWPVEPDGWLWHHRSIQRTYARTTTVGRVPGRAVLGHRDTGHGAGWPDSFQVLSRAGTGRRVPTSAGP